MSNLRNAPFSQNEANVSTLSLDMLLALSPAVAFGCVLFGWRVLLVVGISIVSALFFELLGGWIARRPSDLRDGTAAVTGLIVSLLLPASVPLFVPVLACAFGIFLVKLPFGGSGHNLFNPAAAGLAFVTECFSHHVFAYPTREAVIPFTLRTPEVNVAASPAGLLKTGGSTAFSWYELLIGQVTGPIGTVAILVLVACAVYLFVRRGAAPLLTVSCLAACAVIAALFPRSADITWYESILFELCSGYLMFGAIFMLNDPVTSPRHPLAHVMYGVAVGVLTMLMRHFGQFEESFCFALLLCNAVSGVFDRFAWQLLRPRRQRRKEREV